MKPRISSEEYGDISTRSISHTVSGWGRATDTVVGLIERWGSELIAFSYDGRDRDLTTRLADPNDPVWPRTLTHRMRPPKRSGSTSRNSWVCDGAYISGLTNHAAGPLR